MDYENAKLNYINRGFIILNDDEEYLIAYEVNKEEKYVILHRYSVIENNMVTIQLFNEELIELCKILKYIWN